MCADKLISENSFSELLSFRLCPSSYLSAYKLTDQTFVLDVLQVLCSESVSDLRKVNLLILLQEYGSALLPTKDSVEQAVASLQDIFEQSRERAKTLFGSQLLVTVTSILVAGDHLEEQTELFKRFVNLLLDVVSKVDNPSTAALRGNGCQCLQEIETCYPGILCSKIDHFYQMAQLETTFMAHNFMSLFVTILKNCIDKIVSCIDSVDDKILANCLCNRKEPLKPLMLPKDFSSLKLHFLDLEEQKMPINVETKELKRAISFIMDNTYILTASSHFYVLLQLTYIIKRTPLFSPSIFKPHLLRFMGNIDVSLSYMVFFFKLHFGAELFGEQQSHRLIVQLLRTIHHPSVTPWLRLLLYEWLLHFPDDEEEISIESKLPRQMDYTQYANFFPTVFDGVDTKMKKLDVLSLCYCPGHQAGDSAAATLMSCLEPLQKVVHYGVGGRIVVSLFRILYLYFQRHRQSSLAGDIQRFGLCIVMEQPKFSLYALDFLKSVKNLEPDSSLPFEVLASLAKQIISTPVDQLLKDLPHYLLILETAIHEKELSPLGTIKFLQQILDTSHIYYDGDWSLGNSLLAICRSILHYHDTKVLLVELGDVLCSIARKYGDVDIRDQAKFLYAMLLTLSSDKLSAVLECKTSGNSVTKQSLAKLVSGGANFPLVEPLIIVDEPVIELKRFNLPDCRINDKLHSGITDDNVMTQYWSCVHSDYSKTDFISKQYLVQLVHTSSSYNFDKVYSVMIQFSPQKYICVSDIYLPVLEASSNDKDGVLITLDFKPSEPFPTTFGTSATFSVNGADNFRCILRPLQLDFSDLFQSLNLRSNDVCLNPRQQTMLFENLWKNFVDKQNINESKCAESFCYIPARRFDMQKAIQEKLSKYLIKNTNTDAFYVGIFLMPEYHLLLKFALADNDCRISIVTDFWKILPLVDDYLHDLV